MSEQRAFDVAVFGATGFTGKRVLQYAAKQYPTWRIVAAGRSEATLQAAADACSGARIAVLSGIDVTQPQSLTKMAASAALVLNCVGPYRHYGEPVVKACVDAGTDYLDVCGEPDKQSVDHAEFMERIQLRYHETAKKRGCFVASAIGFDCIPAEVGAALCADAIARHSATPHHVESVLSLDWGPAGAKGHFATYESAVYGFGSIQNLVAVRKEARKQGLDPPPKVVGPKVQKPKAYEWSAARQAWLVPFPGADASVVRRTMSRRGECERAALHYVAFVSIASTLNLILFLVFGGLCTLLASFAAGRSLLLALPGAFTAGSFSKRGPSEEQLRGTSFTMVHEGYEWSATTKQVSKQPSVRVRISGPEPGYVATPIFLVEAAAEVLQNRTSMALKVDYGVCTPGQLLLLHGDGYVERLRERGIEIDVATLDKATAAQ